MVDENLVPRDISLAEMAQLAVSYFDDPETDAEDLEGAVRTLYASARGAGRRGFGGAGQ